MIVPPPGAARAVAALALLLAVLAAAPALSQGGSDRMIPAQEVKVVGQPAGDVTLPTLDGKTASLKDYRGKVVLLNFWASWCGPCQREMPALDAFYQKHKGSGFVVLAVNVDRDAKPAREFLQRLGVPMTFPILLDTRSVVLGRFGVDRMPTSFLIDPKGVVRRQIVGFRDEDLESLPGWIAEVRR